MPAVTLAPLQLYVSALIFTPMDSVVRRTGSIPNWIEKPPVVEKSWGCLLQTFELPDRVKSMAFSPNDQLLAGIDGQNIKIWDTTTGVLKRELIHKYSRQNTRYGNSLQRIDFSSDGRNLVSTADSGEIQMWETETWHPTQRLMHSGSDIIEDAIVSPDNQMLASSSQYGTIKVWQKETDTWKLKWAFSSSGELSFSPNSLLLAANKHERIDIWNLETGEMCHTMSQLFNIASIEFSQDSQFLYGGSENGSIHVWETKDWSLKQEMKIARPDNSPYYLYWLHAVSPDNEYIACSEGDLLMVIETKTWTMFQTARVHIGSIYAVRFSPDNHLMALYGFDNIIQLWDIVPGTSVDDLDKHVSPLYAFVSSPDGSFVATVAWDDKVKVWDTGASALIHTIEDTNRVRVATMAFSPDNKILAWAGHDGYVMVHNIQKKEPIAQRGAIMNHGAYNTEIQFSRSSRLVAAASKLPRVEVWDTETGILVTQEDQNLEGEELDEFIESWEKILQLNENTTVGCNVSYEMAEPSCKFDISIVGGWIFIGLERSIWLPPERRSQWKFAFEQCNNMLVLATQGGQPLIFWFNPDAMSAKQLQIPSYL